MCFIRLMYMRSYTKLSWRPRCFWEAWEFEGALELSYDQMYLVLCLQDAKRFLIWLFASAFFRRAGVSICFSVVTGTVGCINIAPRQVTPRPSCSHTVMPDLLPRARSAAAPGARGASREAAGPFCIVTPLREPGPAAGTALALRSARRDALGPPHPFPNTRDPSCTSSIF